MSEFQLSAHPDWHGAAQQLVDGCQTLKELDQRVELMESVCVGLGETLYPAFLKILCLIGKRGDHNAQQLITETLVQALLTGRLPSGKLTAWGANTLQGDRLFGQTRSLGPIEYLFTWYAQPSGRNPLPVQAFHQAALDLLDLISSNPNAKNLYCTKLLADIEDPLDGSLSSKSRAAIGHFVKAWQSDKDSEEVLNQFLDTLQGGDSLTRLGNIQPNLVI
jgi:hypothetical protein